MNIVKGYGPKSNLMIILEKHKKYIKSRLDNGYIIDKNNCWNWTKHITPKGYGNLKIDGINNRIHRLSAWIYLNFDLESELIVCHKCDNTKCYNPEHLFIGTSLDNIRDRDSKGRNGRSKRTHCNYGHEFNTSNTYIEKDGSRRCRNCRNIRRLKK